MTVCTPRGAFVAIPLLPMFGAERFFLFGWTLDTGFVCEFTP